MLCSCCWLHIYVAAFCHPSSSPHHQYTLPIRLFSAALSQGAWSNRSAMSSPSWSPERSDAWDSPKTRPMYELPIWTMRLVNEGRVLKGFGSAGDWAFKVGVGYNASAGLVWKRKLKDRYRNYGWKTSEYDSGWFCSKSLFVTSVELRSWYYDIQFFII